MKNILFICIALFAMASCHRSNDTFKTADPSTESTKKTIQLDEYVVNGFVESDRVVSDIAPGGLIQCSPSTEYKFKKSVEFNKPVNINGYSTCVYGSTRWKFPKDSAGIKFVRLPNSNPTGSTITGIYFDGAHSVNAPANHGIYTQSRVDIRNCVVEAFAGHGIFMDGTSRTNEQANVNRAFLESVRCSRNRLDGFHIIGNDANVLIVSNCDASNNEGNGFVDSTMTGNLYLAPHTNNNGFAYGKVTYNCIRWQASADEVPAGIAPGEHKDWKKYWDTLLVAKDGRCIQPINEFPKWDSLKVYRGSRPFKFGKNANHVVIIPYREDNQTTAWFNGTTLIFNGAVRLAPESLPQHLKQSTNGLTTHRKDFKKLNN